MISLEPRYYRSNKAGERLKDITEYVMRGRVSINQDAVASPWILTGELTNPAVLTRLVDYIIPTMQLTYPDGSTTGEVQLGHYRVNRTPKSHPSSGSLGSFGTEDLTAVLARMQITEDLTVPAGVDVDNFLRTNLEALGFGPHQISVPWIDPVPSADVVYHAGESWKLIFDNLLQAVGYRSIYMGRIGTLTTSASVALSNQTAARTYRNPQIIGAPTEDHDDSRLCNIVTVRRITPGLQVISRTAQNTDPSSPLWIGGPIGMLASPPIDNPQLADEETAQAEADSRLSYGASFYNKVSINVVPDPYIELFDVIDVDKTDDLGNQQLDGNWLRRTAEIQLGPPVRDMSSGMACQLNRTQPLVLEGVT